MTRISSLCFQIHLHQFLLISIPFPPPVTPTTSPFPFRSFRSPISTFYSTDLHRRTGLRVRTAHVHETNRLPKWLRKHRLHLCDRPHPGRKRRIDGFDLLPILPRKRKPLPLPCLKKRSRHVQLFLRFAEGWHKRQDSTASFDVVI